MSKNVNEFKIFVEFVSNKVQSGNSVTPAQFNEVANRAQMQLFNKDYNIYWQTKATSSFLATFIKNITLAINSFGEALMPSDYEQTASMRSYYVKAGSPGTEIEVKEETNADWGRIQSSQLFKPTSRYPKYLSLAKNFLFLPRTLGVAQLDYFRTPVKPVWNFTIVFGEAVYDPTGSVDFEWDDVYTNEVAAIYLSLVGVNLKDTELAQFSELFKQQNG